MGAGKARGSAWKNEGADEMAIDFDLGFLGGGQLARMSIQAAQRMGFRCISLDPGLVTPASQVAPAIVGPLSDPGKIGELLSICDRITLENEFIPADALRKAVEIAGLSSLRMIPSLKVLERVQDKFVQREALRKAGVLTPKALALDTVSSTEARELGFPLVMKRRFGGYDGRGTRYMKNPEEFDGSRAGWSEGGWMAEQFVPFKRELAAMVFIRGDKCGAFPTMLTEQQDHVCDLVYPSKRDASEIALQAARAMGGDGLFGVEMFEMENGTILVNEIAPRPHNSGHYTLDWGGISQFEQHVRLVMGLPLVPPSGKQVCMANLLGQPHADDFRNGIVAACSDTAIRVHWYGKVEVRAGRKMGHLNAVEEPIIDRAKQARERFYEAWTEPSLKRRQMPA
jgi:5-(carboxyamino)imidazole ribonucleotide synthase